MTRAEWVAAAEMTIFGAVGSFLFYGIVQAVTS